MQHFTSKNELTVASYGALVTAYGNAGQWEKAAAVPRRMRREGKTPNTDLYNTLMTVAAKHVRDARTSSCAPRPSFCASKRPPPTRLRADDYIRRRSGSGRRRRWMQCVRTA